MPKVILDPMMKELRGKMGRFAFRKLPNGEIQMIKLADMSKVKPSAAQKAHRQRFKQASDYAKAALADPKICAIYKRKAAKAHKRPRDMAISDFFNGIDLLAKKKA